jgi:hypothetical protein
MRSAPQPHLEEILERLAPANMLNFFERRGVLIDLGGNFLRLRRAQHEYRDRKRRGRAQDR